MKTAVAVDEHCLCQYKSGTSHLCFLTSISVFHPWTHGSCLLLIPWAALVASQPRLGWGTFLTLSQWQRTAQICKGEPSRHCHQTLRKTTVFIYWQTIYVRALNLGMCNRQYGAIAPAAVPLPQTAGACIIWRDHLSKQKGISPVITLSSCHSTWIMCHKTRWWDPHFSAALRAVIFQISSK